MRLVPRGDLWRAVLLTPQREGMCVSIKRTDTLRGGMKEKLTFCLSGMSPPAYEAEH